MKSLKDLTAGDWYKALMTVTSLAMVIVGELLPESSGHVHQVLVHVGAISAALHAALLKPEVTTLLLRTATRGKAALVLLAGAVSLAATAATPTVEPGTFHQCGLDGTAKRDDLKALNHLKNRAARPAHVKTVDLAAFYKAGDDRTRFDPDVALRVRAVITDVKVGGIETVNCKATDPQWRDTHIELHRTADATDLPIIVEVSPRWRAAMDAIGVDWSTAALKKLKGHTVEIDGWPLFDAEHANQSENTAPGGKANWRQSAWEPAHPVTAIRVLE